MLAGAFSGTAPRSRSPSNPARIAENFGVFDFTLTVDEVTAIDALDTGVRHGPDPDSEQRDPRSLDLVIDEA
jgi:diketogulonate reductase-like aldo/keto reductase